MRKQLSNATLRATRKAGHCVHRGRAETYTVCCRPLCRAWDPAHGPAAHLSFHPALIHLLAGSLEYYELCHSCVATAVFISIQILRLCPGTMGRTILMHSSDRPIGKESIVRFIVLDT